eukprot:scaffold2846_cov322-Pavlova_lutheri.AAC.18
MGSVVSPMPKLMIFSPGCFSACTLRLLATCRRSRDRQIRSFGDPLFVPILVRPIRFPRSPPSSSHASRSSQFAVPPSFATSVSRSTERVPRRTSGKR